MDRRIIHVNPNWDEGVIVDLKEVAKTTTEISALDNVMTMVYPKTIRSKENMIEFMLCLDDNKFEKQDIDLFYFSHPIQSELLDFLRAQFPVPIIWTDGTTRPIPQAI